MTSFSYGRDDLKHASDLCGTRCEMGLGKLCDEQSSEEIVRRLSTLKGTVPDGWLKVQRLGWLGRGCGGGLSSPVAGELELHVFLSWKLSETPVLTSAAKNSTVRALRDASAGESAGAAPRPAFGITTDRKSMHLWKVSLRTVLTGFFGLIFKTKS
jgi:hypothetical protein